VNYELQEDDDITLCCNGSINRCFLSKTLPRYIGRKKNPNNNNTDNKLPWSTNKQKKTAKEILDLLLQ